VAVGVPWTSAHQASIASAKTDWSKLLNGNFLFGQRPTGHFRYKNVNCTMNFNTLLIASGGYRGNHVQAVATAVF
jgi:hypothetical protein